MFQLLPGTVCAPLRQLALRGRNKRQLNLVVDFQPLGLATNAWSVWSIDRVWLS